MNMSGRLLVASPYLTDGNFLRSVVLILQHSEDGAFGLVINRPTDNRFAELAELTEAASEARQDDFIHRGGPVDGPLMALHDLAGIGEPCIGKAGSDEWDEPQEPASQIVIKNNPAEPWGAISIQYSQPPAWLTADEDHLRILHGRSDVRVRYVVDYSGWGPTQLENEMEAGGWLSCSAETDLVFGDIHEVWERCVHRCGNDILGDLIPAARSASAPEN